MKREGRSTEGERDGPSPVEDKVLGSRVPHTQAGDMVNGNPAAAFHALHLHVYVCFLSADGGVRDAFFGLLVVFCLWVVWYLVGPLVPGHTYLMSRRSTKGPLRGP